MEINKSYAKKIKDFDYNQKLVLKEFNFAPEICQNCYSHVRASFKDLSEEKVWYKVRDLIMRDKLCSTILKSILPCFEIVILPEDIDKIASGIKKIPAFSNLSDDRLKILARRTFEKDLIIRELAKEWNIGVDIKEIKFELWKIYKFHPQGTSFDDFVKNYKDKTSIKLTLLQENVVKTMLEKFKVDVDFDSIKKHWQMMAK